MRKQTLYISFVVISITILSFFYMNLKVTKPGPRVGTGATGRNAIVTRPDTATAVNKSAGELVQGLYLSDFSPSSYCASKFGDTNYKKNTIFREVDNCYPVLSETENMERSSGISYYLDNPSETFKGNAHETSISHIVKSEAGKSLLTLDAYSKMGDIEIKTIYTDNNFYRSHSSKIILNKSTFGFLAQVNNYKFDYNLTDIDVVNLNGSLKFFGVMKKKILNDDWHTSVNFKFSTGEIYSDFRRSFMEYSNNNYMLIDIETYIDGVDIKFAHVWKKNKGEKKLNWRFFHDVKKSEVGNILRKMSRWRMKLIDIDYYAVKFKSDTIERYNLIFSQDTLTDKMGLHKKWYQVPRINLAMVNAHVSSIAERYDHKVVFKEGDIPLMILGPHAGVEDIEGVPLRLFIPPSLPYTGDRETHNRFDTNIIQRMCRPYYGHNAVHNDVNTHIIVKEIYESFQRECDGQKPYLVYTKLYRSVADMNRLLKSFRKSPVFSETLAFSDAYMTNICAFDHEAAFFPYQAYFDTIEFFVEQIEDNYDLTKAIAIDVHGADPTNSAVEVAVGYGSAGSVATHSMKNELQRSNTSLSTTSNGTILNSVINLDFLYGEGGFVDQMTGIGIGTYPQGHVGRNTGFSYSITDNLNGGFWTNYLSHVENSADTIAEPNGPMIDTFQLEVDSAWRNPPETNTSEREDLAKVIGEKVGISLCRTWQSYR